MNELTEAPRALNDKSGIFGEVVAELRGPDGDLKARCEVHNLVTAVGDQYYAGRAALSTGLPSQVTGMKLGTGLMYRSIFRLGSSPGRIWRVCFAILCKRLVWLRACCISR